MKPGPLFHHRTLALCLALGLFALIKPLNTRADADDESGPAENAPPLVTVQTGVLKLLTLHQYLTGYGMIQPAPATANEPAAGAQIAAPSVGVVANVNVAAGQRVKKGETLVELNSGATTFALAKAELERQKKLFAQQNTSLKNLQEAAAQLDSLRVTAPLSGTVTRLNVSPGGAVDTATVVAEVADLNRLAVTTQIPAAQAGELKTGQEVQINDGRNPAVISATLTFISPAVDPGDGTVSAWAALPPHSGLRPGQFVDLKIVTATKTNCLAAPDESVVTDENGGSVISLVNGDESVQTPVQTGLREDGWVEVGAPGLKAGDAVVTSGAYGLPDKTKIQIANPPGESVTNHPAEAQ